LFCPSGMRLKYAGRTKCNLPSQKYNNYLYEPFHKF
jgi:hypothetical protein